MNDQGGKYLDSDSEPMNDYNLKISDWTAHGLNSMHNPLV